MPAKHSIKIYEAPAYYHLYNRGVEKRPIFLDAQDYTVFLSYLKTYLTLKNEEELFEIIADPTTSNKEKNQAKKELQLNNFFTIIYLMAFCLMPNHFHLLVRQTEKDAIDRFMNSLCTRYTMYFNKKYNRIGTLFQSVYKAVRISTDEQLLHVTRYLHRNIISKYLMTQNPIIQNKKIRNYPWSSYKAYILEQNIDWVHREEILSFFGKTKHNTYASFVEMEEQNELSVHILSPLELES